MSSRLRRRRTFISTNGPTWLSIGELSRRTGVPQATLRTWESRYGLPRPERLASGHRRFREADVDLVQEVLRRRSAGLSLEAALGQAQSRRAEPTASLYASLRRRHPQLRPHRLSKPTLLALTRAIEDECLARADRGVLFVSFQHRRFYERSATRWQELSRTADAVVVFAAGLEAAEASRPGPLLVPLPPDAALGREWAIVCDAVDQPAVLVGWEQPRELHRGGDRYFEVIWSVDPVAVRDAARGGVGLVERYAPDHAPELRALVGADPQPASADLRRAAGVLDRLLGYLAAAADSAPRHTGSGN